MSLEITSKNVIEKLLLTGANGNSFIGICSELASDIINKKTTFVELVESLESLLTSPDLTKHTLGLDVLAYVVESLPRGLLCPTELDVIVQFFCDQVKQHHSFISAVLKGLVTTVHNSKLSRQSLHQITSSLFNNVVWQSQTLSDRKLFYSILQYIVSNRIEDYMNVSSEFLFSIISSVDGERDPRNLLLLFSFLPTLFNAIPLGPLAEDAFDVVSCYFPVDFYSSGSEPGSVTRDDLVSALNPCLLAIPDFARFCIPLILEKLESTLKSAKIDSYNLLAEGCGVWPSSEISPYTQQLWQAVRQDCLPPRDPLIADSAIAALQALVAAVSEPSLTPLLTSISHTCEGFLKDVQMSLFEPASRLVLAAMAASHPACQILSSKLVPVMISLLEANGERSQVVVLEKLKAIVQVCLHHNVFLNSGRWETVCRLTSEGSMELQQAAYSALALLVAYLGSDSRLQLYPVTLAHLNALPAGPLRSACIKFLQVSAQLYEDEVQENIVQKLSTHQEAGDTAVTRQNQFEVVCRLAVKERFHPEVERMFLLLTMQSLDSTSLALSCLRNVLEDREIQSTSFIGFLFSQSSVLPVLVNLNCSGEDLLNAAAIIQVLVRLQSPSEQARVVEPLAKVLLQHTNRTHQMVLLEALLGPLWPEVAALSPDEILAVVVPAALHLPSDIASRKALQLLASLLNKSSDDNLLEVISQHLQTCPLVQVATANAYVTKALVLRGHPLMEHWLNKLVDLLDSEDVDHTAAEGIRLIVQESEEFLNQQNHCLVKLLYRQRLFHIIVPRLVLSDSRVQHLKALAYSLQSVPQSVYHPFIEQILPLLVKSLDTDCETLLLPVLLTLSNLTDVFLEDQMDAFIPRFLNLSQHSRSMKVRIAALQCLHSSLKLPPVPLLPHKQQVLAGLVPCLDDRKRLVRQQAARTRSKWFLLGAPSSDS